jgi:hypothetical protein
VDCEQFKGSVLLLLKDEEKAIHDKETSFLFVVSCGIRLQGGVTRDLVGSF